MHDLLRNIKAYRRLGIFTVEIGDALYRAIFFVKSMSYHR